MLYYLVRMHRVTGKQVFSREQFAFPNTDAETLGQFDDSVTDAIAIRVNPLCDKSQVNIEFRAAMQERAAREGFQSYSMISLRKKEFNLFVEEREKENE